MPTRHRRALSFADGQPGNLCRYGQGNALGSRPREVQGKYRPQFHTIEDAKSALSRCLAEYLEKEWRGRCQRGSCGGRFFATLDDRGYGAKGHPGCRAGQARSVRDALHFPDAGCAGRAGNSPNTGNIARLLRRLLMWNCT